MSDSITLPAVEGRDAITLRMEQWATKEIEIDVRQGNCRLTTFFTTRNGLLELREFLDGLIASIPETTLEVESSATPPVIFGSIFDYFVLSPFKGFPTSFIDEYPRAKDLICRIIYTQLVTFKNDPENPDKIILDTTWIRNFGEGLNVNALGHYHYLTQVNIKPLLGMYCRELLQYLNPTAVDTFTVDQRLVIVNELVRNDHRQRCLAGLATLEDVVLHLLGLQQCTKPLR